jgi:hydroxymethylbilane synthase
LKDWPAVLPDGLVLAAFPEREDARDVLIFRDPAVGLKQGAVVGTTSVRRQAVLRHHRPDLRFLVLRGNVGTRLRKLREGACDAIVLAAAGLNRLDESGAISEYLALDFMIPAAGQGCLAVEARADRADILARLQAISHPETERAIAAERGFLARLGANCQLPVGAHAISKGETVVIRGFISSLDGIGWHISEKKGPAVAAAQIGSELAEELLRQGGGAILAALEK